MKKKQPRGASVEDYLKAILELSRKNATVNTTDLAQTLSLKPPSVTAMLKRLKRMALVDYTPYQGCTLQNQGERIALKLLRSHRLFETWLVARLGFNVSQVDAEAESVEHALSERVVNRMEELLNFPTRDPHGAPIPRRDLTWPKEQG